LAPGNRTDGADRWWFRQGRGFEFDKQHGSSFLILHFSPRKTSESVGNREDTALTERTSPANRRCRISKHLRNRVADANLLESASLQIQIIYEHNRTVCLHPQTLTDQ
jgi:hypothetical protein